jgi:hypothetical protein
VSKFAWIGGDRQFRVPCTPLTEKGQSQSTRLLSLMSFRPSAQCQLLHRRFVLDFQFNASLLCVQDYSPSEAETRTLEPLRTSFFPWASKAPAAGASVCDPRISKRPGPPPRPQQRHNCPYSSHLHISWTSQLVTLKALPVVHKSSFSSQSSGPPSFVCLLFVCTLGMTSMVTVTFNKLL